MSVTVSHRRKRGDEQGPLLVHAVQMLLVLLVHTEPGTGPCSARSLRGSPALPACGGHTLLCSATTWEAHRGAPCSFGGGWSRPILGWSRKPTVTAHLAHIFQPTWCQESSWHFYLLYHTDFFNWFQVPKQKKNTKAFFTDPLKLKQGAAVLNKWGSFIWATVG